jgi:hypothetical protein
MGLGATFSERRIYSLSYHHEGNFYHAVVGEPHSLNGEPVIAILYEPVRTLYQVCTPNRGVARGISILVGADSVESCVDFT